MCLILINKKNQQWGGHEKRRWVNRMPWVIPSTVPLSLSWKCYWEVKRHCRFLCHSLTHPFTSLWHGVPLWIYGFWVPLVPLHKPTYNVFLVLSKGRNGPRVSRKTGLIELTGENSKKLGCDHPVECLRIMACVAFASLFQTLMDKNSQLSLFVFNICTPCWRQKIYTYIIILSL